MAMTEIDIPRHCPLCHKFVGNDVYHVVLSNSSVACIHCWHLVQLETIQALYELADWMVNLNNAWKWIKTRCRPSYWLEDRRRWRRVAERHHEAYPEIYADAA